MTRTDFVPGRRAALVAGAGLLASASLGARAQSFPTRALHVIVPFTPGGSSDVLARAVGTGIGRTLNQPVIIARSHAGNAW